MPQTCCWRLVGLLTLALALLPAARGVRSVEPIPPAPVNFSALEETVRNIVLEEIKQQYDDQDNWGHQELMTKYQLRGKWLDTRWVPYQERVNDGLWQRSTIRLVEPEKNLSIQVFPEPTTVPDRNAFALVLGAKMEGEVQVVRWRMGFKMLNTTVQFTTSIIAVINCDVAIRREPGMLLDDVVLDPRVTSVDLQLRNFQLDQLGILGRDIARELSGPIEPFIARQLDKREPKIMAKLNAAIEKRRDKLRFSPSQLAMAQWSKFTSHFTGSLASMGNPAPPPLEPAPPLVPVPQYPTP